jgi:3-deoxy-D-manno-octulosonic-acid transferase
MFTHFSPSGMDFARKHPGADLHDYLPLDRPRDMRRLVEAWQPRALVFVKFDVWPNLVLAARDAGVPVFLIAGSLQPRSGRLRWPARHLYRDVFDRFTALGVSTEEDRRRFTDQLAVQTPVHVTGDTRVEQVIVRYEQSASGAVAARLSRLGSRRLILGSTWPPDEDLWLPVLRPLLDRHPDLRVILCPHEPLPERLAALEGRLDQAGLRHRRLQGLLADGAAGAGAGEAGGGVADARAGGVADEPGDAAAGAPADAAATPEADPEVVLVDSVGVLAEIYRAGTLAYVGGSFTTGVHNTMEPAIGGLPVLFGPRIHNAEEAGVLVRRGAGFVCTEPPEALARADALLADPDALHTAGEAARQVVLDQRGATERTLAMLRPYLQG